MKAKTLDKKFDEGKSVLAHFDTSKAIRPGQEQKLDRNEKKIVKVLSGQPMHIDEIIRQSNTKPQDLHAILLALEVKGVVSQVGGMKYVRTDGE